jgi:hypothetical protein
MLAGHGNAVATSRIANLYGAAREEPPGEGKPGESLDHNAMVYLAWGRRHASSCRTRRPISMTGPHAKA